MQDQSNPLGLGETHCTQCGEPRPLEDETCAYCRRLNAFAAIHAADAAADSVRSLVQTLLEEAHAHPDDLRKAVEEGIEQARPYGADRAGTEHTSDEYHDQVHALYLEGVR